MLGFVTLNTRDPVVLAIRYDWRHNSVHFIHNPASTPAKSQSPLESRGTTDGR